MNIKGRQGAIVDRHQLNIKVEYHTSIAYSYINHTEVHLEIFKLLINRWFIRFDYLKGLGASVFTSLDIAEVFSEGSVSRLCEKICFTSK